MRPLTVGYGLLAVGAILLLAFKMSVEETGEPEQATSSEGCSWKTVPGPRTGESAAEYSERTGYPATMNEAGNLVVEIIR